MSTRIDRFPPEASEVNTWIVGDDEEVIVIDPGADAEGVLDAVGDREILAVICTHGHAGDLPGSTRVLPGSGPETTVAAAEKKFDAWVSAGPVPT